jgi:hypothetical protein
MKFYLEDATQLRPLRRGPLLSAQNEPKIACLCNVTLNLEKGEIVEQLPQDAYLWGSCKHGAGISERRSRFRKPLKLRNT